MGCRLCWWYFTSSSVSLCTPRVSQSVDPRTVRKPKFASFKWPCTFHIGKTLLRIRNHTLSISSMVSNINAEPFYVHSGYIFVLISIVREFPANLDNALHHNAWSTTVSYVVFIIEIKLLCDLLMDSLFFQRQSKFCFLLNYISKIVLDFNLLFLYCSVLMGIHRNKTHLMNLLNKVDTIRYIHSWRLASATSILSVED